MAAPAHSFRPPPPPRDPAGFDRLVLRWWGYCERWAERQARIHTRPVASTPVDFGPEANLALWRAAATYDPARGTCFMTHLRWQLKAAWSSATRTQIRRDARLARVPLEDQHHPRGRHVLL